MLPRVLFQHVPKTAGTTLFQQLAHNYPDDQVCPADFFWARAGEPPGVSEQAWRAATHEGFRRFALVANHIALLGAAPADVQRVSVLRHPLDRVVSQYKDYRSLGEHDLGYLDGTHRAMVLACRRLSLNEMFERFSGEPQFDWIFRFAQVGNVLPDDRPPHEVPAEAPARVVERALDRAASIDFLADAADFDAFCPLLLGRLGFERRLCASRVNQRAEAVDYVAEPIRRAIAHEYAYYDAQQARIARTRRYLADCAYFRGRPDEGLRFDADGQVEVNERTGGVFERLFWTGRLLAAPLQAPAGEGATLDLVVHAAGASPIAVWLNARPTVADISAGDGWWRAAVRVEPGHRVHGEHLLAEVVFDRPLSGFAWEGEGGARVSGLGALWRGAA